MAMSSAKPLPWYAEWFGAEYVSVYAHRDTAEAERQADLAERVLGLHRGDRILDLCCGAGRHSLEFARRGYHVTGIDLSPELLELARSGAREAGLNAEFIRCDMRRVVRPGAFDAVVSFFTSFGYFESDQENARVLENVRASLAPGGRWLLDYLNRDQVIATLVPEDTAVHGDVCVTQQRRFDFRRGRVEKTIALRKADGSVKLFRESVRAYTLAELERMCARAGLRIDYVFGDADGAPYHAGSPRLVIAGSAAADVSPSLHTLE